MRDDGFIDAFATQPHYLAHLVPIWWALPAARRGCFYLSGAAVDLGDRHDQALPVRALGSPPPSARLTLVAGHADEQVLARPLVYVEHGAGQTYRGDPDCADDPSYSGSAGHDRVVLFICPSQTVADRWGAVYPDVPAVAVGCPRLDRWHTETGRQGRRAAHEARRAAGHRSVALSFHHHSQTCAETKSSWPDYYGDGRGPSPLARAIAELKGLGWHVMGHWHPRLGSRMWTNWAAVGAEPVESIEEVFARADVFAADNTSALPEAASVGIPLVFMNAPGYRRHVDHGGRFWDWPGDQASCDGPAELPDAVETADLDLPAARRSRLLMVSEVYAHCDGHAAVRAAHAVTALRSVAA